jgi:hypothetical protein
MIWHLVARVTKFVRNNNAAAEAAHQRKRQSLLRHTTQFWLTERQRTTFLAFGISGSVCGGSVLVDSHILLVAQPDSQTDMPQGRKVSLFTRSVNRINSHFRVHRSIQDDNPAEEHKSHGHLRGVNGELPSTI